jgi:hypothetical protein
MALSTRRMGRRLLPLCWAVPMAMAVQQAGPNGIGSAEACSGGVSGLSGMDWRFPTVAPEERLPIATDGFVLITGASRSDASDSEVPLPWVRVTNEAGVDLPGQLRVLQTEPFTETTGAKLAWESDEPLALGTVAKLSWSETEEAGAGGAGNAPASYETIELEVVAEPTPLPVPTAVLSDWVEVRHGVGELVECESYDSCGPSLIEVPTEEVRVPGVGVSWELPTISGMVAWEVWAETSAPSDGAVSQRPGPRQLIDRESEVIKAVDDLVVFADDAAEHCVVMVVKDLRTGEESRSEPECQEPGEPISTLADHSLSSCDEPPTPESLSLWCLGPAHAKDERCSGVVQEGSGGQAASGNDSPGGQPSEDDAAATRRDASDGGCTYAPAPGSLGFAAAALGVMLMASRRRRVATSTT